MKKNYAFKSNYAINEVIGGLMLVIIAVITFSAIYMFAIPEGPDNIPTAKIEGYVMDDGSVLLRHVGGNPLTSYKIDVEYQNGTNASIFYKDRWTIGDCRYPLDNYKLENETFSVNLTVFYVNPKDESEIEIFTWKPCGNEDESGSTPPAGGSTDIEDIMLYSSLRNDTTDEDLICHTDPILSNITFDLEFPAWDIDMDWQIDDDDVEMVQDEYGSTGTPGWIREDINDDGVVNYLDVSLLSSHYGETQITYIYNWTINSNSISEIVLPFDTNNNSETKDYSGKNLTGLIYGPTWQSSGIIGGTYQFDGIDNYINLPYCFDEPYIDDITVEFWINTSSDNMVITSYDKDDYWEIGLRNGVILWSTTANGYTSNLYGSTIVNDNLWHHIAVTYSSSFGECSIYVDGLCDTKEICHLPNYLLGSGVSPNGYIGTGNTGTIPGSWTTITYDDFEDGFGNYTDGGRDCILYSWGTYAHQGDNAANIQDDSGEESSFSHTNGIDVDSPGYTSIKVDFWFRARDMENGEDFWVMYYDGTDWEIVADYDKGDEFVNDQFYHEEVWINETDYTFPTDMKIRFQCDASYDWDDVYIDEVYVNASVGSSEIENYSGLVDEYKIYNVEFSGEQIFQNYLCTRDGFSDLSVFVSEETILGQIWRCFVTPNDGTQDDILFESNPLEIIGYGGG